MIEIKKERYYLGLWYARLPHGSWLACAWKDKDEADWHLQYRIAVYQADDVWGNRDLKYWEELTIKEVPQDNPQKAIQAVVETTLDFLELLQVQERGYYPIEGDGSVFEAKLTSEEVPEWLHVRERQILPSLLN